MLKVFPCGHGLFSRIMSLATLQTSFKNDFRNTTMTFGFWPSNIWDLNTIKNLLDVQEEQAPPMEVLSSNLQDLMDLLLMTWCKWTQQTFRSLMESMSSQVSYTSLLGHKSTFTTVTRVVLWLRIRCGYCLLSAEAELNHVWERSPLSAITWLTYW